jgi:hypothetical protein
MIEGQTVPQSQNAFDPESLHMLGCAFEDAWDAIRNSGSRLAKPAYCRMTREIVAKRIIEMARQGVKDPRALSDEAVRFLAANYADLPGDKT